MAKDVFGIACRLVAGELGAVALDDIDAQLLHALECLRATGGDHGFGNMFAAGAFGVQGQHAVSLFRFGFEAAAAHALGDSIDGIAVGGRVRRLGSQHRQGVLDGHHLLLRRIGWLDGAMTWVFDRAGWHASLLGRGRRFRFG